MSTPRRLDLPPEVRRCLVTTPRGQVATLQAGPDDGRLVLVPGWTGSKEDYLTLLPELAARGRHAVALDQRGQFETPGPDDNDAYGLDVLAADLLALAETLGARTVDLVGHSFGGLVVTEAAVRYPLAVSTATLLCSGPGALPSETHDDLQQVLDRLVRDGPEATWRWMREEERASGAAMPSPEVERFLRRRFLAGSPAGFVAFTRHLIAAPDRTAALARRPVPVLVVAGELDDGWPLPDQRALAQRAGGAYVEVPGAGHSPAVDDPATTAAAIRAFLDEWSPARTVLDEPLGLDPAEVPRLRRAVRALAAAGAVPPDLADDLELVVSELVTNALLHGTPPARLRLRLHPGSRPALDVEALDAGGPPPDDSERPHHGRGLRIVDAIAARHGDFDDGDGRHVWAQLPAAPAAGHQDDAAGR